MEIVAILRTLRRHRPLVGVGAVAGVLVALLLTFQVSLMPPKLGSRTQTSGAATAQVIIAARTQPAFDLKSQLTDTLGTRAAQLADLLATDTVRARIARIAGLAPGQVAVNTPAMGPPELPIALAVSATEAAALAPEPYLVTVTTGGQIPIITLKAGGPDAVRAARVADAAATSIGDLIAGKSAGRPDIIVERLGPAVTRTVVTSPSKAVGLVAAIGIFTLWCATIVVVSGLGRRRRSPSSAPVYSASA
jgi:hypothetical protein